MSLIGFAIGAVAIAVVRILIGIVDVLAVAGVTSPNKVTNAMRPCVVRIHADSAARAALQRQHHPVVVLCSAGRELAESSDFILESRIQETECATVLRVVER